MKNIHILPTDKPILDGSINYILKCIKEFKIYNKQYKIGDILDELSWDFDSNYWKPQNIYITNDEEIKEGDWVIYNNELQKSDGISFKSVDKKIILTTDQDLIKDGIQAIDDEFLEWFVKNPSCEVVEVIKTAPIRPFGSLYKTIIPKEKPKQCTCENPTDNTCNYCDEQESKKILEDAKLSAIKQETLEEAAEKYDENDPNDEYGKSYRAFIEGAKWQQERMYSEEDMVDFALFLEIHLPMKPRKTYHQLFEQFKKK